MNAHELHSRRAAVERLAARQRHAPHDIEVLNLEGRRGDPPILLHAPPAHTRRGDEAIVWFHGGGFVTGGLATHSRVAGRIAHALGRPVALVGYRLAPEHPFPAAFDDARRAVDRLSDRALILGGDSAGANLALGVSHFGTAEVTALLLAYPFLDLSMRWSHATRAAFPEDWARLDAYRRLYLDGADPDDPRASPASLGAPPVARLVLALADRDPLAGEARAFADDARSAGVEVFEHAHARTRHGFLLRDDPPSAVDRLLTDFAAILATRDPEPATARSATEGHHV